MTTTLTLLKQLVDNVICLCGKIPVLTTPIPVIVENPSIEVDPSTAWDALFQNVADTVVASVEAQTNALTPQITSITDALNAGITVNAVQSGTWDLSIAGQPLSVELTPANISSLAASLQNLQVNINGQPVDVNVQSQSGTLQVQLDPTSLAALEDINVTVGNTPLGVSGTVTVDSITNAITVDWTGLKAALDGLEVVTNFDSLTNWFSTNEIEVSLNGEEIQVDVDDVVTQLTTLTSEVDQVEELLVEIRDKITPSVDINRNVTQVTNGMDGGLGNKAVSAILVVPSGHIVSNADTGTVNGVSVPVGYGYSHSDDSGGTLTDNIALSSTGSAYWIVTTISSQQFGP